VFYLWHINFKEQRMILNFKKGYLSCLFLLLGAPSAFGSMIVEQWYHGEWDCRIDGRPAKMIWKVIDDSQVKCYDDGTCTRTSGVKTAGWFSDSGRPWVKLDINSGWYGGRLGIRYLGQEPDNWYLDYNSQTGVATGKTTWRGSQYPLSCFNKRIVQ
jgi:hypothetical protein